MFKCFLIFALFMVHLVLHKNSVPYVSVRRLWCTYEQKQGWTSMFLDVLIFVMSIKNHRQFDCILSVTKLLICFNQSCNFSILNYGEWSHWLHHTVLWWYFEDLLWLHLPGQCRGCWDTHAVSVGVVPVIIPPLLVLLFHLYIIDTTKY